MKAKVQPGEKAGAARSHPTRDEPITTHTNARYVSLFLIISLVYLCTVSDAYFGGISDGRVMFHTAVSLHELGELEIGAASDPSHDRYGRYGLGFPIFLQFPLLIAAPVEKAFGEGRSNVLFPLTNMALTAMTALLVALCLRELGFLFQTGALAAIGFAFGTLAWPYISYDFSEPLQALCVVASFWLLIHGVKSARHSGAFLTLTGIVLGFTVLTKAALAILIPSYAFYLWASLDLPLPIRLRRLAWFGLPLIIWGLGIAVLNLHRFGSAVDFGYGNEAAQFTAPILTGLYGLLFSPNKGLVFYAPLALLLPWSLWKMRKGYRIELIFLISVFALQIILTAKWWAWEGGLSWGPRLLMPILPLIAIGAGMLLELSKRAMAPFVACTVAGVTINLLGVLIYFTAWPYVVEIQGKRIPLDIRGRPAREYIERDGRKWFGPWIATFYLPELSPIRGHVWLLRLRYFDHPFSIKPLCDGTPTTAPMLLSFAPVEMDLEKVRHPLAVSWLCSGHFWLWATLTRQPREKIFTQPLYGEALELQGDRAFTNGDLQRTLQFYTRAADLMPNDARALDRLARFLSKVETKETFAHLELALLYELSGDRSGALREYKAVLQLRPSEHIRRFVEGRIALLQKTDP